MIAYIPLCGAQVTEGFERWRCADKIFCLFPFIKTYTLASGSKQSAGRGGELKDNKRLGDFVFQTVDKGNK